MAIRAKIVLPDNLESSFLRSEFLSRGAAYSDRLQSDVAADLSPDATHAFNKHAIVLGFALEDTETRSPVPLERVVSLKISNDPRMAPESTVEIQAWPAAAYDETKLYRYVLNPLHFVDPLANAQTLVAGDGAETPADPSLAGYFVVDNWPLSCNGGLSTVYVKAVVKCTLSDEQVSYPEGYGVYDQILWQSERPSAPGTPVAYTSENGLTGRETLWRFGASEEPSSGVNGGGVSRYLGDVLETRGSTKLAGTGLTLGLAASSIGAVPTQGTYSGGTFSDGGAYALGAAIAAGAYSRVVAVASGIAPSDIAPDVGGQAYVSFGALANGQGATLSIALYDGSQPSPQQSPEAFWAEVAVPQAGRATARAYRTAAGVQTPAPQAATTLPDSAAEALRACAGGLLEAYLSQRPGEDHSTFVAYLTPAGSAQAFVLCRALMPPRVATGAWRVALVAGSDLQNPLAVSGIGLACGRFTLAADLGDCQFDAASSSGVASFQAASKDAWREAIAQGDAVVRVFDGSIDLRGGMVASVGASGVSLHTAAPPAHARDYVEIAVSRPTFSDRALVRWSSLHLRGDLYVALSPSPRPDATDEPMGMACDPDFTGGNASAPPCLLVGFSALHKAAYVAHRKADGSLVVRDWLPYEGADAIGSSDPLDFADDPAAVTWSLVVSNFSPSGEARGTWLSLYRNEDVVGATRLEDQLPTSDSGTGFYVAVGARSYRFDDVRSTDLAVGNAGALLKSLLVRGLAPIERDGVSDVDGQRHFRKANGSPAQLKPLLGQTLLSGVTDLGGPVFSAPVEAPWTLQDGSVVRVLDVDHVAIASVASSGAGTLDQAPLWVDGLKARTGQRVLVCGQALPAENGVYVVGDAGTAFNGVWTRDPLLSVSAHVVRNRYVRVAEPIVVDVVHTATVTPPAGGSADIQGCPLVVDGVTLEAGQLVLLTDSGAQSGVWSVVWQGTGTNGVWRRSQRCSTAASLKAGTTVRAMRGAIHASSVWTVDVAPAALDTDAFALVPVEGGGQRLDGTLWHIVGPVPAGFALGTSPLAWRCTTVAQRVSPRGLAPFFASTKAGLLELQARPSKPLANPPARLRAKIAQATDYELGPEGPALTPWLAARELGSGSQAGAEGEAAATSLAQFHLGRYDVSVSEGQSYWILAQVPPGFELLSGHAKAQGLPSVPARGRRSGVTATSAAWHKLFASATVRHDNVCDGAAIQMRAVADSHARFPSMASSLATAVGVDVAPPAFGGTGRPRVTMPRLPTVRTATLWIEAADGASGVAAFRVGKENGQGSASFGEWQPFADYASFQQLLPCRVAYQGTSTGDLSGLKTVDGVTLVAGDRVLVYASAPASFVGVYHAASGAWSRAPDLSQSEHLTQQLRTLILQGAESGKQWYVALPTPASAPPYYALGTTPFNWQRDLPQRTVAEYTVYLHGFWPQDGWGADDALMRSQNAGLDGSRRLWVQAIDALGNVSEAEPITVPAQGIALVDTVPPSGAATFVDRNGAGGGILASASALLRVDAADRVSEVKDVRVRDVATGAQGAWGPWTTAAQFKKVDVSQPFGDDSDGLRRVEVQARDYGNNVVARAPHWDQLDLDESGRTIACMTVWRSTEDAEDFYYAGGVKHVEFEGYGLRDAELAMYGTNRAFFAVSTAAGAAGRTVAVRANDVVAVRVNGAALTRTDSASSTPNTFFVDSERGVVVLSQSPVGGATLECDVVRDTAVLVRGNGRTVEEVADLGRLGERIVLAIAATASGLFLGTDTGSVYAYDGFSVEGPLFNAQEAGTPLPITAFVAHRFAHEDVDFLYACTAGRPRLYRKALDEDALGAGAWSPCGVGTADLGASSGDALSLCSAFGKVFVGTSSGTVVRYWRALNALGAEQESISSSVLKSERLRASESSAMPVSCLLASGSGVYAGVADKPEVWRLAIKKSQKPRSGAEWSSVRFDRLFSMDPAPWQYYTSSAKGEDGVDVSIVDGNTISRASDYNLTWFAVSDETSQGGMRDYVALRGQDGKETNLSCGPGSDWEQAIGGEAAYGLEVCPMRVSGAGRQGIRVADGRYEYVVSWDDGHVYLSNGVDPELSARLDGREDGVSSLSLRADYGGGEYPRRGVRRMWNFALGDSSSPYTAEDRGPREPGSGEGAFSAMGWAAGAHVVPAALGAAGVEVPLSSADAIESTTSWEAETRILRVTAAMNGDPMIVLKDAAPAALVSGGAKALVRARVIASDSVDLSGASLRLGWSSKTGDQDVPENWTELPLRGEGEFRLYEFRPSWDGYAAGLALELSNVGEVLGSAAPRSLVVDLDYIAIVADEPNSNFTDNGTPVRVGVSGQDVTVWAGFTDVAQLSAKGFLTLPTERVELRLGKVDAAEAGSEWGYSGVAFATGFPDAPVTMLSRFALAWRFPSAGGVTHLLHHRGTMHALTRGEGAMRMADSPDDRAAKAWAYDASYQGFGAVGPTLPRLDGGEGVVRFLAACDYRGVLVASGQKGQIAYAP